MLTERARETLYEVGHDREPAQAPGEAVAAYMVHFANKGGADADPGRRRPAPRPRLRAPPADARERGRRRRRSRTR